MTSLSLPKNSDRYLASSSTLAASAALSRLPRFIDEKERISRVDLTEKTFVTIDGEDAQDYDDAIFCESLIDGFNLIVAIADVAHYVKLESEVDLEACSRGTSVYFPLRVIPMLPEVISNNLCSLVPNQEIWNAVETGQLDSGFSSALYILDKNPELSVFSAIPFGPSITEFKIWMRYGGGQVLKDEIYAKRGIKALTCGFVTTESAGWFKKRFTKVEELKGINM